MDRDTELMKQRAEAQLREWRGRLETWQAKLDQQRLSAEEGARSNLDELQARMDDMGDRLRRLEVQGRDASGELRRSVENAWHELENGFKDAQRHFQP